MNERYVNPAYPLFSYSTEDVNYNFVSNNFNEAPLPENVTAKDVYKEHFSKKKK